MVTVSWRLKYGNNDTSKTFSNHKKTFTIQEFTATYEELIESGNSDIMAFKIQCNKMDGIFLVTENSEGIQEIPGTLSDLGNKALVISATNVPAINNPSLSTLLNFQNNQIKNSTDNDITFVGTINTVTKNGMTGNSLLIENGEYFSINNQLLGSKSFTIDFFVQTNAACPSNSCICDINHPNSDIKVNVLTKDNNLTLGFLLDNRLIAQTKNDITVKDNLLHIAIVYHAIKSFLYFFVNGNLIGNINVVLTSKITKVWFNRDITNSSSTFIGNLDQIRIQNDVAVWIPNQPYQDYETQVVDDVGAIWQMHNGVVTAAPEGKGKFPGKVPGTTTGLYFNNVKDPEKYPDGICKLKYQNDVTYAELVTPIKLGADDFTIDFWCYFNSLDHVKTGQCSGAFEITMIDPDSQQQGILGCHYVYVKNTGYRLCIHGSGVTKISAVRAPVKIQTLCHVAIVFTQSNGKLSVFVDGIRKKTVGCVGLQQKEYDFHLIVGRYYDNVGDSSNGPLDGAVDEFRISAGIARWTENFSLPTEPYKIDEYTKALMRTSSFEPEQKQEKLSFEEINPNKTFTPSTEPYINRISQVSSPETADFCIPIEEYFDDSMLIPIKLIPVQANVLLYDGVTEYEPVWLNYDPQALRLEGDIRSSELGIHYVTFTPINDHVWWNGSSNPKTVSWKISAKSVNYPTAYDDLMYDAEEQDIPIIGFDQKSMTIEGTTVATNANTLEEPYYVATVKLKPGYIWQTGNISPYEVRWRIKPAIVERPVLETSSLTFVYDGTEKRPVFDYDDAFISVIGTAAATVPNMTNKTATLLTTPYEFAFSLKDKRNFRWSPNNDVDQDGGTENIPYSWYIKRKPVETLTVTNMELVYNTMEQGPDITPSVWNSDEVTVSGSKATVTGNYKLIFQLTDVALYEWSTGATEDLVYQWSIIPAVVEAPILMTQDDFVYDGTTKQLTFSYDNSLISQTGTIAAVNPNVTNKNKQLLTGSTNYTVTFSLKDKVNYVWSNNNTDDINHVWFIRRKVITKFTITDTSFVYNTQEQGPTLNPSVWNSAEVTVTDSRKTTAGSYTLICTLTDISKYEWSDGSTANLTQAWTINKRPVTIFAVTNNSLTYNTKEQGPVLTPATWDSAIVTVTNNRKTTVGSYTIVCHLVDITNYEWTDGSTANKTYDWNITPAQVEIPVLNSSSSLDYVYDGIEKTPAFTYSPSLISATGNLTAIRPNVTNKNKQLLTGATNYTITFSLKDKTNYVWTDNTTTDINHIWFIRRKQIVVFKILNTSLTYNTKEQGPDITPAVWNSNEVIVSGSKAVTTDNYKLIFKLSDITLYEWSTGTTDDLVFAWSIQPAQLKEPTATSSLKFVYDTTVKTPTFAYDNALIAVSGDINKTNPNYTNKTETLLSGAKDYVIIFSLNDKVNYVWETTKNTADITQTWIIKRKLISRLTVKNTTFTYNTEEQKLDLTPSSWNSSEVAVTGNKGTDAQSYTLTCKLQNTSLYEWDDGTIADIVKGWIINPQPVAKPTLAQNSSLEFVYSNEEKTPIFNYDDTLISISGTTKATVPNVTYSGNLLPNHKDYIITFKLNNTTNYVWSDNTIAAITKAWHIKRKPITIFSVKNLELTYNTKEQGPTLTPSSWNNVEVTVTGNKGIDAKSYTLTCKINNTDLYEWNDGTTADITKNWIINPKAIDVPVLKSTSSLEFTYDNTSKQPIFTYDDTLISTSGNTDAVLPNVTYKDKTLLSGKTKYSIVFILKDKNNYVWSNGTTANITETWCIKRKPITKFTIKNTTFTYNKQEQGPTLTPSSWDENEVTVTNNKGTAAKSYTLTCQLKDIALYEWSDGTTANITQNWSISVYEVEVPVYQTDSVNEYKTLAGFATYDAAKRTISCTYDNTKKTPLFTYDANYVTKSGITNATAANYSNILQQLLGDTKYLITFALKDKTNYRWKTLNNVTDITFELIIKRIAVTKIVISNTALTYKVDTNGTGVQQSVVLTPALGSGSEVHTPNTTRVAVTGNKATNAGTYTAICTLKNTDKYEWDDGTITPIEKQWTISPKPIAIPTATSLEFTYDPAQEQGPTLNYDTQFVQVSGTQKATNANFTNKTKKLLTGASNYVITFALKDTANFKWSNNTTAAISSTWFIKRQLVPTITFKNLEFIYNPNKDQGPTLSSYNSDIVTVTNNSKRDAGSYTVKCHLADSANYEWNDGTTADITQSWSIAKANGSISLSGKYNGKAVTGTLRLVASETVKKPTMTFTVSRLSTGKVTCTTNSNLEITVAADYSTLTVTGKIDTNEQPVTLTITAAADNNYNAATTELNVIVVIGLEMFSWTEIADMAADGTLLNHCKIGDYKTIPTPSKFTISTGDTTSQLNTEEKSLKVVLIGYNHNSAVEGQRVAHFMFGKLGEGRNLVLPNTKVPLFMTTTNSNGWSNAYIRDALADGDTSIGYENLFPDELMGVMKPFVKWTDNIGGGINKASYVTPSLEYVSLLSEYEVFGTNTYGSQGEALHQKQYDYFKNSNVLQRYRNDNTTSNGWALRTVDATNNKKMVYVKPDGTVGTCDISTCLDVPFIFAVSKKQIGTITVPSVAISIETLMHFDDPNDPFKDECNTQFVAKSIKNDEIIAPDISDSPAKFNKAIRFNNTNYIQQTKGIMLGGKDFTIDFWIYVDKDTSNIDGEIGNLLQMRSTSFNLYWRRAIQSPTAEVNHDKRLNTMIRRHYKGQTITYEKEFEDDDGNIYYKTVTKQFQKRGVWRTLSGTKIDSENCPLDKWFHVAVEYDHAEQQFFVLYNGRWVKQAYNGGYTETGLNDVFIHKHILFDFPLEQYRLSIGWAAGNTRKNGLIGAIDELRITNGVMRWPIPAEYYDIDYVPNNEVIFTPPTSSSGADDLYVLHDQVSGGYIVNLDQNNKVKTFNIGSYQGTLKVISSHPDIATAAISNKVLTITGLSGGTSKIVLYTLDTNSTVGNTVVFTVICNKNIPYVPLASATPAEIQDIITSGKAAEAWELGDTTADIKLSGTFNGSTINKTVKAILVDIDHNISIESGGKPNCHFLLSEPMDGTIASDKGVAWSQSPWKTRCTEIYNCMPTAWKNVIGTTVKYANDKGAGYADDSAMKPFEEKVWLFTYFELSKKTNTSTTMSNDGFNQQYYPFMKLHAEDLADGTTLADGVWLRSRHKTANMNSRYVFKSGAGPTDTQLQACFGINGQ